MTVNPHDHNAFIQSLKDTTKEIKQMPRLQTPKVMTTSEPTMVMMGEPPEMEMEQEEFDLDRELEELQALAAERAKPESQPAPSPEEALKNEILRMLDKHPNRPSSQQIDAWKAKHGPDGVQVVALDAENVYIFTHLTASQWDKIKLIGQASKGEDIDKAVRERVLKAAILWPRIDEEWFMKCRAGLPSTLYDLILVNSYFLSPQQALTLTTRL